MYCSTCGNKISDDARFCPVCGAATSAAASPAAAPGPSVSNAQDARGDLGSQVRRARRLSLAALSPTVLGLLIAFFVLTTVAVAALLIYFNIYLPAQQQAAEQSQVEQPAEDAEEEPDAQADAAVFDTKLVQYQQAQRSNWNVAEGSADEDVAGVVALFTSATAANAVSGEEASWVASYDVADVNGDGLSELVVALVSPDGEYRPLAVYATDGTTVSTVAADAPTAQPQVVTVCSNGTVEVSQTGQWGSVVVMGAEGGAPVELTRFEWGLSQGDLTWSLYERGQLVDGGEAGGLEEVFAHMPQIDNTPYEGLDWQPLSSYGGATD